MRLSAPLRRCVVACSFVLALSCARREAPVATHRARRVVTLAPNATEMLFWLGCGEHVVGTDDFSNYPAVAKSLPHVGGMHPNVEKIVRLRPDLVIGTSASDQSDVARALRTVGVPFEVLRTERLEDIPAAASRLATRVDCPSPQPAIAAFESSIASQRRVRTSRPRVLVLVWPNPLYVAGRKTFADDLLQVVGAENAVAESVSGWPSYSMESIVARPPDLLLFPSSTISQSQLGRMLENDPVWRTLGVVKSHRYFVVDDDVFSRPGPRMSVAATELNHLLDSAGLR